MSNTIKNPLLESTSELGKYEGEIGLTQALWESGFEDELASYEDAGGCYCLYRGLDQGTEFGDLDGIRAAILYESGYGFVTGQYFESEEAALSLWDEIIAEVYPDTDMEG